MGPGCHARPKLSSPTISEGESRIELTDIEILTKCSGFGSGLNDYNNVGRIRTIVSSGHGSETSMFMILSVSNSTNSILKTIWMRKKTEQTGVEPNLRYSIVVSKVVFQCQRVTISFIPMNRKHNECCD